jgi:hypothetical protein
MAPIAVCALALVILLKPQEFVPALMGFPLVYVLFGVSAVLIGVDVIRGRLRLHVAPNVIALALFFVWGFATTVLKRPDAMAAQGNGLLVLFALFAIVSFGTASAWGVRLYAMTYLATALIVTTIAIVQGLAPLGCVLAAPDDWEGRGELEADGRPCETFLDCRRDAPVPEGNYRCEHVGPWRTTSIGGRVRYRGSLADPNELSLMAAMAVPISLAIFSRRARRTSPSPERVRVRTRLPFLVTNRFIRRATGS